MKKTIAALAALVIVLAMLAACAGTGTETGTEAETETAAEETVNMQDLAPVEEETSGSDAAAAEAASDGDIEEAPASEADAEQPEAGKTAEDTAEDAGTLPETDQDMITAQSLIGHSVDELYEAIGEPSGGAQYSKSCMDGADENAQDGMLYYDTFSVWTYRTDDSEIVQAVYEKN